MQGTDSKDADGMRLERASNEAKRDGVKVRRAGWLARICIGLAPGGVKVISDLANETGWTCQPGTSGASRPKHQLEPASFDFRLGKVNRRWRGAAVLKSLPSIT